MAESEKLRMKPVGDQAVLAELGDKIEEKVNGRIIRLQKRIESMSGGTIRETVPAFTSLLVYYDPLLTDAETVMETIERLAQENDQVDGRSGKLVEIPVCYGGIYGEDLSFVAEHAGISEEEVIRIHSGRDYLIYMLGFLPGFPYLGGMDPRIATPRLQNPRTKIPAGSVGIGGEQTGIYPMESPGGWQLIGRTPLKLFNPEQGGETLYQAGDRIRFVPIGPEEFEKIQKAGVK